LKVDEVSYKGLKFKYRHDTTDWGIIKEACGGLNTRWFDVEPGEIWADIGAHIGSFTCYAASKKAVVMAFEPVPANFTLLIENIALNGLQSYVQANNKAVTGHGKPIKLFLDTMNFGNCGKYEKDLTEYIYMDSVKASRFTIFDELCLKIDTEGCEYEILSQLDLTKVKKLVFEYHDWLDTDMSHKLEVQDWIHTYFPHQEEHGGYMHYAWR
jgi:FkbM family methyltransferase